MRLLIPLILLSGCMTIPDTPKARECAAQAEEYAKQFEKIGAQLVVRATDDKKLADIDDAITLSIVVGLAFAFIETIIYGLLFVVLLILPAAGLGPNLVRLLFITFLFMITGVGWNLVGDAVRDVLADFLAHALRGVAGGCFSHG